jgi:hypothetical protein
MAILTSALGNLSGKVGNLVFRVKGGKTYVSSAPGKRKNLMTQERKNNAIKFGVTGKIAGLINSIPDLQEVWKKYYNTKKSVFTKIFKKIHGQMTGKDFNKSGSLVPDFGFPIKGQVISGKNFIIVETEALGNHLGITEETEKFIQAVGIIVFKDPINDSVPETTIEDLISWPPEILKLNEPQLFCFAIDREKNEEMRSYGTREFHMHLITRDDMGQVAHYSEVIKALE